MKLRKIIHFTILSLLTALISMSLSFSDYLRVAIKVGSLYSDMDNGYIYYQLQHEKNPLNANMETFQNIYQAVTNQDVYKYYEIYEQPLDISYGSGQFFDDFTMELSNQYERVACVQISENVQYDFEISVLNGRLLNKKDFLFDGKNSIPILMGYDYDKIYDIGDSFAGEYLFEPYNFYIIGFLDADSSINMSIKSILLRKYIVMPSFEVVDGLSETDGIKIHYANKTSGIIKTSYEKNQVARDFFMPIINHTETGNYSWYTSSVPLSFQDHYGVTLQLAYYITVFIALLLVFAILLFILLYSRFHLLESRDKRVDLLKLTVQSVMFLSVTSILYLLIIVPTQNIAGVSLIPKYMLMPLAISCFILLTLKIAAATTNFRKNR